MTEIQRQILIILGAPNSGFTLLADCLGLLGIVNLAATVDAGASPPSLINRLLLQDLEYDPGMIGNLPDGWTETTAAATARTRIEALLARSAETNTLCLIADPTLSRLLPLWLAAFRDHAVEPRFVHLVRHPWETACSLAQTQGVDSFQGHLLWLASHRAALAGSTGQIRTFITLDQLLANPVSTLTAIGQTLEIDYPIRLETAYARLLSLVRPEFKHHHAGNAPEEDQVRLAPFVRIYNALRLMQAHRGLGLEGDHASAPDPADATLATAWASLGLPPSPGDAGAELADLLFTALGVQERQSPPTLRIPTPSLTRDPEVSVPLLTAFYFPQTDGADRPKTIVLLADEWRHITLPVPQPELLRKRPLHFTPLNHTGTVWIAALKLVNQANGEVLWTAQTPQDFDTLELGGTLLRAPDLENLMLLVTGNDPYVSLPVLEKLPDCPILLEAWMRVSSKQIQSHEAAFAQTVMKGYLKKPQPQLLSSYLKESDHEFHEESFVDSIMEGKTNFNQTEKFRLLRELGEYQITQQNNLRALHYFTLARTFDPDESKELFLLAQNYFKLNQKALALEVYLDFWLKWVAVDDKAAADFKKLLRSYQEKAEVAKEHGQQLLIHYINQNLEFIRSRTSHKLTLIEIGSTREDVPGQGSTRKLAQLCQKHQFHFITVDMDPRNTSYARNVLNKINPSFEAITSKGEDFLKDYTGPIDFVFLDAYDFEHGKHSEERQLRYEQFLGDRINDQDCHQMHLECAQHLLNKLSPYGAICIDDSWFINDTWAGKGTTAVPFLLQNNFNIVLSGNRSVLLVRQHKAPTILLSRNKTAINSIEKLDWIEKNRLSLKKIIINTIPKSGTYMYSKLFECLGYNNSGLHIRNKCFWDFRGASLDSIIKAPDDFKKNQPIEDTIHFIKTGQFAVGHIDNTISTVSILSNFTHFFCIRNIKEVLVSHMRFICDDRRKDKPKFDWSKESENAAKFIGYLKGPGKGYLEGIRKQVNWINEKGVIVIRYEEVMGDYGSNHQQLAFEKIKMGLGINTEIDIVALFNQQVLGQKTRTYSGFRSQPDTYWNNDVEKIFHEIGASHINSQLGY
jgi:hypothetical protein